MPKRTAVLSSVVTLIVGFWMGWMFGHGRIVTPPEVDPIAAARAYAVTHYPRQFGTAGTELTYTAEDSRDSWIVEVAPQGQIGGGIRLIVRRKDGYVELVGKTQ
ncbi:hypothetical protein ACLB0R_12110 [Sphingomonas sp. GlSt437]|uniref:hypothetical protein n=1 Tax=Sphingomonas sp. GlSt437 TaxID=3389970 RepID=UPI003A8A5CB6